MKIIKANCVDEALFQGMNLLLTEGIRSESRVGPVLAVPYPVQTCNEQPMNRVMFSPQRDANPFFHVNEALWMLAGRNDIEWLDQFVKGFSKSFGEAISPEGYSHAVRQPGTNYTVHQHGAYGFRWRNHFDVDGGGEDPDQLGKVIKMMKANPNERRAVIGMWDPVADLDRPNLKDVPCNTHIYLRIRDTERPDPGCDPGHGSWMIPTRVLDLTVCCRSNDAIWGAHGANAVHFSILQEYLAARIGVGMGVLYQYSNNYHGYMDKMGPLLPFEEHPNRYLGPGLGRRVTPVVTDPAGFDEDLVYYFSENWLSSKRLYRNSFFVQVAIPLRASYALFRKGQLVAAGKELERYDNGGDWIRAALEWYDRRLAKRKAEGDEYAL